MNNDGLVKSGTVAAADRHTFTTFHRGRWSIRVGCKGWNLNCNEENGGDERSQFHC
jgi:hypothetical protein